MSRHRLKLRRAERARLQRTASRLGDLLGWHRHQTSAFWEVLTSSSWRHCRRNESEQVLLEMDALMHAAVPDERRGAAAVLGGSRAHRR